MSRCLQLAKNGLGTTYPNPLVGSVIVFNDKIIGEGWHYKAGEPHSEVNAISSVTNPKIFKKATIYVTLEPCSHVGKTPPCADLIIQKGIKNVVIGSLDPNPEVSGRGIKKLMDAGCSVTVGVLENECNKLNKRFFTFHQKKRPYIFLKWAQSLDNFIAPETKSRKETKPVWITNEYSRQLVHKFRGEEMAILVGTTTVLQDNPSLTTRHWSGSNPTRIVIDKDLKLSPNSSVFDGKAKTILFTEKDQEKYSTRDGDFLQFIKIDFSKNMALQICDALYDNGIQSLIVEGGTRTIQTFIAENLWDEAFIFIGTSTFGRGIKAPEIAGELIMTNQIKEDSLRVFRNQNQL